MAAKKTLQDLVDVCSPKGITVISTEYVANDVKLNFKCHCGHTWSTKPMLLFRGQGCRRCGNVRRIEQLDNNHPGNVLGVRFTHTDGVFKAAVRSNVLVYVVDLKTTPSDWKGLYRIKEKDEATGTRVVVFYKWEWDTRKAICLEIVGNICGLNERRVAARKCVVTEQSGKEFFESTHLMGNHKSSRHVTLTLDGEIVAGMSYRKEEGGIDISRFSCAKGTTVQGGFSKLLAYIVAKEDPAFVSNFVDMRYGVGTHLLGKGFTCQRLNIGFHWVNKDGKICNRLACRANMDDRGLTEKQHAVELELKRTYDAGQARFVWVRKPV